MRSLLEPVFLFVTFTTARFLHSLPEDPHTFPKFCISFLNSLPVSKAIAHHWLISGLSGGLLEFIDQPWNGESPRGIEEAASVSASLTIPLFDSNFTLEHIRIGLGHSYVCFIPAPPENTFTYEDDLPELNIDPSRSWELLQPLTGTCLYHRQGWFTYSYCHNDQIRQFKEAASSTRTLGGYKPPEEDPEWEAYTLGKAPQPGIDLTVAEENLQTASFELAQGTRSRYLVQRWGDGTPCDKTGINREVEVQFHCSMTMTDTILFVKETKTCSYVLVVHTPRLCGEPGFKSLRDNGEESQIRCREIVEDPQAVTVASEMQPNSHDMDYPAKLSRKRPVLPSPVNVPKGRKHSGKDAAYNDLLKTIETIFSAKNSKNPVALDEHSNDDNDVVFELVDSGDMGNGAAEKLAEALRDLGFDVKTEEYVADAEDNQESPTAKNYVTTGEEL